MLETLHEDILFYIVEQCCRGTRTDVDLRPLAVFLSCSKRLSHTIATSHVIKSLLRKVAKTAYARQRFVAFQGYGTVLRAWLVSCKWRLHFSTSVNILRGAVANGRLGYARLLLEVLSTRFPGAVAELRDLLVLWKMQHIASGALAGFRTCESMDVKINVAQVIRHTEAIAVWPSVG